MNINEDQFAFRSDRDTAMRCLFYTHCAKKFLARKEVVFLDFIDFKNAFDLVNQKILWEKLRKCGTSEKFLKFFRQHTDWEKFCPLGQGEVRLLSSGKGCKAR